MNTLAMQQQALLGALLAPPQGAAGEARTATLAALVEPAWQRGLAAYRANSHALAERSLRAAYPVVAALVSDDSFAAMARDFWHRHPPVRGDLACWGGALAEFVSHNPQLADAPYLADVARVEWALHRASGAADAVADPDSFALLSDADPDTVTLRLPAGTEVIESAWPVASLVTAHLDGEPAIDAVAARVRARQGEVALVWRQGLRARLAACTLAEAALIRALADSRTLLAALDAVLAVDPGFDLGAWLPQAVQTGLVTGAARTR